MQRAAQERLRASLIHKAHYQSYGRRRRDERNFAKSLPVNLFRKTLRIGGCSNSRCYLCHGEKLLRLKRLWEKVADDKQRDGELDSFSPTHEQEE